MRVIRMNALADYPLEKYHIAVYCECGHTRIVNNGGLPGDTRLSGLERRLLCNACGARHPRVIIAYHGGIGNAAQHHGIGPVR